MQKAESMCVVYRCRRCGELDKSACGSEDIVIQSIINTVLGIDMKMAIGLQPQLLSTHSCQDGSIGVSDLIGGEKKQ